MGQRTNYHQIQERITAVKYCGTYNYLLAVMVVMTALLSSCEKKELVVKDLQIKNLPTLSARNLETMYSDSGQVTMIVRSSLIQQFSNADKPHTIFPEGLLVLFYDKQTTPQASIASKYARYSDDDEVWELRDSVVAVSNKGEKLETELLYWSEPKDRIWSDRFVRFTQGDQIIMGTGFESDTRFSNWAIKNNVTGTVHIQDEQKITPAN